MEVRLARLAYPLSSTIKDLSNDIESYLIDLVFIFSMLYNLLVLTCLNRTSIFFQYDILCLILFYWIFKYDMRRSVRETKMAGYLNIFGHSVTRSRAQGWLSFVNKTQGK